MVGTVVSLHDTQNLRPCTVARNCFDFSCMKLDTAKNHLMLETFCCMSYGATWHVLSRGTFCHCTCGCASAESSLISLMQVCHWPWAAAAWIAVLHKVMICLITVAATCHAAPMTPNSMHACTADAVMLSTLAHTPLLCDSEGVTVRHGAVVPNICASEESSTSKYLSVPTVNACVLTGTTTSRVRKDYTYDAVKCPSGELQANASLPHFLADDRNALLP